jgi:hypothetical protein
MKTFKSFIVEGRPSQRHPLEGHEYHRKTDAELVYIAKDAHKAAEAMKGHNTQAENKYRDQANDSATVRYYRQKNGMPNWYKKKYGHMKEDTLDEMNKSQPSSSRGAEGVPTGKKADPVKTDKVTRDALKVLQKSYKDKKVKEEIELDEVAAWQRKEGKNPEGGLNQKGVESYRRENPGSKLQTAVTTEPSKLKKGSKAWNRRKSFCARMGGMPGPMKDEKGRPTRKALSLRKWNC